ncbi:hypothetical protein LPJ56_000455 [Coemansia sp. RSA 2599]|nr:hypothetical protein LPJ75_000168 [Coemansia sp. RSA 2598]KAJ1829279.1 hypothetical protein LPJ56_000455 [Coemansia sp. RSA 2599]
MNSGARGHASSESTPILAQQQTPASRRGAYSGTTSTRKALVLLAKAFIGSGMLFLPKAFSNGGLLFSGIIMALVAMASLYTMQQLASCHIRLNNHRGGYGTLARKTYGRWMKNIVEVSIVVSQLGFSCAGSVFVATSLRDGFNALSGCRWDSRVPLEFWIAVQMVPLAPLCLIRHVRGFSKVALVSVLGIFAGLAYVLYTSTRVLATRGLGPNLMYFNQSQFPLFLGSAAYTFEGYALILPIATAMRRPQKMSLLLVLVMTLCAALAIAVGGLSYAAFGDATQPIIILNMPAHSAITQTLRIVYGLAIIGTTPLMMFPAFKLLEPLLFGNKSGKTSLVVKTGKTVFRLSMLVAMLVVAAMGIERLDRLVAVIGGLACVPLAFIYPPLLHLRVFGRGPGVRAKWIRVTDWLIIVTGVLLSLYVTAGAINRWGFHEPPYNFCKDPASPLLLANRAG